MRMAGEDELGDAEAVVLLNAVGDLGMAAHERGALPTPDQVQP
jgi:hypothetical protein